MDSHSAPLSSPESSSASSSGLSSPLSPHAPTTHASVDAPPTTSSLLQGPNHGEPTHHAPTAATNANIAELAPGSSLSVSATTAFLTHEASLSELLVSAPATLARDGSAPLQQETIETLSGTAKELASLNQFATQRLTANKPNLTNAVQQIRDLKVDLDLAHRRLFKLIQQLKQVDPEAVRMAEEKYPLELEDD
ncbi:hypothetical protein BCR44DRAFT_67129 [Catenaria anguillulae PL171]|uniref:KxDL domain-containing protein n=1 Tax=Catenaria anguillulae PL171 TaxID=765915 RepID=A0A1Y2HA42_9FUNG|nr:hypothetical protein BCR44DRAFT_67129 [Catenaria anguillulae PL171]